MSRFAEVVRGTRATKVVELPLARDVSVKVAVRPLNGLEFGRVIAAARAYAIAEVKKARRDDTREPPEPKEGDRLFDLGYMVSTLDIACEDPEKPGTPFFDGTAEILEALDADRIALLYEQQQAWQDYCSPRLSKMGNAEFAAMVFGVAGEDESSIDSPFALLRPALRLSWARTLARLYVNSLTHKSEDGDSSISKAVS